MTLSKSAIIIEQILNDVPMTQGKRGEAFSHLQAMETQRNELEGKISEMQGKIEKFQEKLDKYQLQQEHKAKKDEQSK